MEEKEKKKATRPTWAMVRELEHELSSQLEVTSMLVKDCDAWRDKCRLLSGRCDALEQERDAMCVEVERLRSRGFWKRVFFTNKS